MALSLKPVEPARGARWVGDAFRLFARRPLGFTMLFVMFLAVALFSSLLPLVGGVLQMMLLPLLSLGFMVASQSVMLGGGVRPDAFVEPLRGAPERRNALLALCALYGVAAIAILLLADAVSGGALAELQELMARNDAPPADVDALLADRGLAAAVLVGAGLGTLLSVVFWHAPALVHWGGQGVAQALFSSTLAVWRSKGAFFVYGLAWLAIVMAFGAAVALVFGLIGASAVGSFLALPAGLLFSTVFYVSLIFTFHDSFGGAPSAADEPPAGLAEG